MFSSDALLFSELSSELSFWLSFEVSAVSLQNSFLNSSISTEVSSVLSLLASPSLSELLSSEVSRVFMLLSNSDNNSNKSSMSLSSSSSIIGQDASKSSTKKSHISNRTKIEPIVLCLGLFEKTYFLQISTQLLIQSFTSSVQLGIVVFCADK